MRKFTLIILLTFNSNLILATNFYVDKATGNDSNNGLTLTSAWKTIQKAAFTANAGSTVFIKSGTYFENVIFNLSGTLGNSIVFRNYNSDVVILDGTGTSTASGTAMIQINGASHLEFRNLIIQNLLCPDATGVVVYNSPTGTTDLKFINLSIHDIKWTQLPTTVPTTNNNAHPFLVYGSGTTQASAISNVLVDGCTIYNNVTGFSENLTHSGNVDGFVVSNNVVRDNNNIGIECEGNYGASSTPSLDHARNGVVKNNKIYNTNCPYSSAAGIYVDGGWDITVENNESYANTYGVEIGCEQNGITKNITVKNNIFYNNKECGIYVGGYDVNTTGQVLNCIFRNNSLFQNDTQNTGVGEIIISKATNCKFENNVFYTNSQNIFYNLENISPQAGNTFNYNCWYTPNNNPINIVVKYGTSTYTSFPNYKTVTGQETSSIYINPMFVNSNLSTLNMAINSGMCINYGNPTTVIAPDERDFAGLTRVVNVLDIGAYEKQSALGISGFENDKMLKLYPNPVSDILNIQSEKAIEKIEVFDELGKQILNYDSTNTIDLSKLNSGLYFLKIKYNSEIFTNHKIMKL
jgi:Secretion system C-terminal sorting domain/Right handed beta helix region